MMPLTDLERGLALKLAGARFPPSTASKRFARDLQSGYIRQLSDRGRMFFAFVVHRFRRQYSLTEEERRWVDVWLEIAKERAELEAELGQRSGTPSRLPDGREGPAGIQPIHAAGPERETAQGILKFGSEE